MQNSSLDTGAHIQRPYGNTVPPSQRTKEPFHQQLVLSNTTRFQRSANRPSAFQIPSFPSGVAQINAVLTHLATDNLELAILLMRRPSCETLGLLLTTPNSKPRPSPPGLFLCWSGKSASGKDVQAMLATATLVASFARGRVDIFRHVRAHALPAPAYCRASSLGREGAFQARSPKRARQG
jgi:hypothetical protein